MRASDEKRHLAHSLSRAQALGAGVASGAGWVKASAASPAAATREICAAAVRLDVPPPVTLLLLGAGPETPSFLSFARGLGWTTVVVDHRAR